MVKLIGNNDQVKRPKADVTNRTYQRFLTMIGTVTMISFFQQIRFTHHEDKSFTVQLPWELEFQIRHNRKLRTKSTEEPFSQDQLVLHPLDLNKVLSLDHQEDDISSTHQSIRSRSVSKPIKLSNESISRQEKASTDYREKLRQRAQQLVANQGWSLKNKHHLEIQTIAARKQLLGLSHHGDSKRESNDKKDVTKFTVVSVAAAATNNDNPKFIRKGKKEVIQSSDHTGNNTVPRLFGKDLENAITSHVKPRRSTLPTLFLEMCDACENAFISERFSCKRRILPWIEKNPVEKALQEGQAFVASENKLCKACAPESCKGRIHFPLKFDEGAPLVLNAKTHDLKSIPKNYRIPEEFLFMTNNYFKFWTQDRPPIFFTYNPSVIQIPPTTEIDVPGATYLASYRVSPWHNCGFNTYNFHAKLWNLMGLALLDENLDIIEGFDVVVNINEQTQMREEVLKFEDFRLFYFNDKLWLLDGSLIVPIQIRNNHKGKLNEMKDRLPVLFGTGLTVGFLEPVQHILEVPPGKNYNLFLPSNGGIYLEQKPRHPRVTIELDFEGMIGAKENGEKHNYKVPADSFMTDELYLRKPYLLGPDKGTACCSKLEKEYYQDLTDDPEILKHDYLLMGIGHRRTFRKVKNEDQVEGNEKFDYLSRLYAFVPETPFEVVANSGMFCFGFPDDDEAAHLPYANATKHLNKMEIFNKVYTCPTVQKATGMVDKVGDPDRIIVSYGVNDCIPRMVELHKQDLAHRLFLPLSRQDYTPQVHR